MDTSPLAELRGRRLFRIGLSALAAAALYFCFATPIEDPLLIAIGISMLGLAALPFLEWARKSSPHFPMFEIFMLTSMGFYALPLLNGHPAIFNFSAATTFNSALMVMIFQISAITTFKILHFQPRPSVFWTEPLLPDQGYSYVQIGLWLSTAYAFLEAFTDVIPYAFISILRAVFYGLGIVTTFILCVRLGAGKLDRSASVALLANLALQLIFMGTSLYLNKSISIIALGGIGYISSSRRIPIITLCCILPIIAILHNGKPSMRAIYWNEKNPIRISAGDIPGFYSQWIEFGLKPQSRGMSRNLSSGLMERASLFQMLCLCVERVPDSLPFLDGKSYADIPAQLVPSILWPDKPSSLQSNKMLGLYFGLVDERSAQKVSIAFGVLPEAYTNFGLLGVISIGVFFAAIFKFATNAARGADMFSILGFLLILLTAWSLAAEMILATWLTSLFQACIVVIGIPAVIKTALR